MPTIASRANEVVSWWRDRSRALAPLRHVQQPDQLASLTARVEHLEAVLEGLQDAVYRQSVSHEHSVAELRKRTDPRQLARELSEDARRRGL